MSPRSLRVFVAFKQNFRRYNVRAGISVGQYWMWNRVPPELRFHW